MSEAANDLPDLEKLMRNVIRFAMEAERGTGWINTLGKKMQEAIERSQELAEKKRPDEALRDGWDSVGLGEIAALVRSENWPAALSDIWADREEAMVDLRRLTEYRDRNLHAVGAPVGQFSNAEAAEIIQRLRVRFEAARRNLQDDAGDWWPYIEAVHSNIPGFCFTRSAGLPHEETVLNEGDRVVLDVVGVNPLGSNDRLRYGALGEGLAGLPTTWSESGHIEFDVPRAFDSSILLFVSDEDDTDPIVIMRHGLTLKFRIRPARRGK